LAHSLISPFTGELLGTLVLILLGDGVVAAVNLKQSKGSGGGWITITAGWAMAVFAGVMTARAWGSPDANLNPAITLALAVFTGNYSRVPSFLLAQLLGAMAGALLVWLAYLPHWKITEDAAIKRQCFCTAPAIRSYGANFLTECIATAILVLLAAAMISHRNVPHGLQDGIGSLLAGSVVWGIGMSLGGPTGYAINPARDLGPRIAHAILPIAGKGPSDWAYAWVPVCGPLAGAALAAWFVRLFGVL
jgi:glycerol uptake facilitator protein